MKRIFVRIILAALALYLFASAAATAAYNLFPAHAWEIARHRNGLLIVDFSDDGVWVLSPFDNYGDSWL